MRSFFLIFSLVFSSAIAADPAGVGDYDLKSKPKVRVAGDESIKPDPIRRKALIVEKTSRRSSTLSRRVRIVKSEKPEKIIEWGGDFTYSVRTDMADQVSPRVYSHTVALSYGFQHVPSQMSLTGILAGAYESLGERRSEILVDSDRAELFVNDFTLAAQWDWETAWKSELSFTLANEFPTSPEAQREEYGSVTSLEVDWSVPLFEKKFGVGLRSEVYYIWNTYEYSPATLEINKQGGWRGEANARWTVWEGLYTSVMIGSQLSRYLDGTNDVTYRNAIGIGYAWPIFSVSLGASNGTYLDRDDANVWFVDEYRRMVSMRMKVSF